MLVIADTYASLREEISAIPSLFDTTGEVIYRARNEIRVIRLANGLTLNVKRFHKPAFPNQIIYTFFRPSKAARAYRNALRFAQLNLPTPEPVAYIECKTPLLQESYLITLQSPLSRTFYEFRYHPVEGYEDIIRQFALLMADMHQKGVYHQDLSPGNILFDKDAEDTIRFALVDINRVRFAEEISMKDACRNFCRLWGKMDFIERLSMEYAQARGWSYPETLHWITTYWKQFWHIQSQADIDRIFDPSLQRESF
ncbi:MAG: tyrosine protein kinase [Paludibacteraceae bacterium]|nr:tyrosine protein kinase [Paludibacteraceae bacterium]